MVNFYGGQKGENYVVSKIFPNKAALLDDLRLEENSDVGLYEIVMISYGEYSNYENSDYQRNLAIDNSIKLEEGFVQELNTPPKKENLINLNSSLYQKVPNIEIRESEFDISVETEQDTQNNQPILRFKYKFLTSSIGEIPKIQLYTGESRQAWETPVVEEHPYKVIKGYYFSQIDTTNKFIYLSKSKPEKGTIKFINPSSNLPNYNMGWKQDEITWNNNNAYLTLINNEAYEKVIKFKSAQYNVISYTLDENEEFPFEEIYEDSEYFIENHMVYKEDELLNGQIMLILGSTAPVPKFDVKMPQVPTIVGSNGNGNITDSNGEKNIDIGILINPKAKNEDNTEINPYTVITFSTITENNDQLVEKKDENNSDVSWIEYGSQQEIILGVNYNQNNEPDVFSRIQNIRGPEGPPGRIPQIINGNWYVWQLDATGNLVLNDSELSATFAINEVVSVTATREEKEGYDTLENYINKVFIESDAIKNGLAEANNSDMILGEITWKASSTDNNPSKYSIVCYKKTDGSIGWTNFIANGTESVIEKGTGTNSLQQRYTGASASGKNAAAFGDNTVASEKNAFAEGSYTEAKADNTHAEGDHTKASSAAQHVQGKYNIEDANNKFADIIGNGTADNPSNAYTLDWEGNAWFEGIVMSKRFHKKLYQENWKNQLETKSYKYILDLKNDIPAIYNGKFDIIVELDVLDFNSLQDKEPTKQELQQLQREYAKLGNGFSKISGQTVEFTVYDFCPNLDLPITVKVV